MQVASFEQFADQKAHAAGGMEVVHVGDAVGIDAGEERDDVGEFRHILPGDVKACCLRDGDEVERMVGGTARRKQPDKAVDQGLLVDDMADGGVVVAFGGEREGALRSFAGQGLA